MKEKNTLKSEFIKFFNKTPLPRDIVHFQNIVDYKSPFYFDDLFQLLDLSHFRSEIKHNPDVGVNHADVFSHVFETFDVRRHPKISSLHEQLANVFGKNLDDKNFRPDIFTSFKSSMGNPHSDNEDVCIIGLCGSTYYSFPSVQRVYEVSEGGAIYIPKGTPHAAHSFSKRMVVSWSRFL
jgi:quercetin dioxygenase-like cupin family protein|tara:strand:+ start:900 stop:1439 length:540 start_codon:yes stop_codon:yes gene_type:complete